VRKDNPIDQKDYKPAYYDVREVLDHPIIVKAVLFARDNPDVVFGVESEEYKLIQEGFLSNFSIQ